MKDSDYFSILDNLYDGVYFVNSEKKITFWNKKAEAITQYTKNEVLGSKCSDNILKHIDESCNELCIKGCPLAKTLEDGITRETYVYLHRKDGIRIPVNIRISPVYDNDNNIIGAVEIFKEKEKNYNKIKQLENIKKRNFTDNLSGCGNKEAFEIILKTELNNFVENSVFTAIIAVDIDDLNKINKLYSEDFGNRCIRNVGQTINNIIRDFDSVFRYEGGTFFVLIENIQKADIESIAERIRFFIEKTWLFDNYDNPYYYTVSVSATYIKTDDTFESIVDRAFRLLKNSKQKGKNIITCDS